MNELEKATWEFLFNTPSVSLLKHGRPYSDLVEAVTSDREKAFKAGAEWQKQQFRKIENYQEEGWYSSNDDEYIYGIKFDEPIKLPVEFYVKKK